MIQQRQQEILEAERDGLRAIVSLAGRVQPMLELIQRMVVKHKLSRCAADLTTKAVSDKAKEFASKAVTATLRDALNAEIGTLGMAHLRVKLDERVEHGKHKHKLVLDLPKPAKLKLNDVLSEGEQRALAIASFLAELSLAGHKGGIVFDDPVSSLDHYRRSQVAHRLVAEAKHRQVVVFTHDTVFLGEVRDAVERTGVNHRICHLEWENGYPGNVCDGLPWEHQSYKERLDHLDREQRALEKSWPAYPSASHRLQMRDHYECLRATIERSIQDVVFNGVISRYRDWVRVNKLRDVAGLTREECAEIMRLDRACSDVIEAHDHASAKNAPVPDPTQLSQDIASLRAVIQSILARRPK